MQCPCCSGKGKIVNSEWQGDVERMVDSGNYDYFRAEKQASRWNNQYDICSRCQGTGQVEE